MARPTIYDLQRIILLERFFCCIGNL